jgi:hypothetical protein
MSFTAMALASKQITGNPTRKLILLLLADRANEQGICWPSLQTIARDCELSVATVKRQIKELEKLGLLQIKHVKTCGAYASNQYLLSLGGRCTESLPLSDDDNEGRGVGSGRTKGRLRENQGVGSERATNLSVKPIIEPEHIYMSPLEAGQEEQISSAPRKEKASPPKAPRFSKPTELEVYNHMCYLIDYRKLKVDQKLIQRQAQKFWHHHEANGWKRGKNPIKKWKSAVVTWMCNDYDKVFEGQATKKPLQI